MTPSSPCPCGSGTPFDQCHGTNPAPPPLPPIPSSVTRKLDLACGQRPMEGFEGVDIWPKAQHVVDLQVFPWPFEDSSVAEVYSSHYIEHIPMVYVDTPTGPKDALFAFFDECFRILIPGGWMTLQWPALRSNRAFQDPTHRRFIPSETMGYLGRKWREIQKLDHYNVLSDFEGSVEAIGLAPETTHRHSDVQVRHMQNYWNTIQDFICRAKSLKAAP